MCPPSQAHLDGWFPGDVCNQAVHCNVLAVHLLVHKPADVLGQPVTVEVEVVLQGRWEGGGEEEEVGGRRGGGGGGREEGRRRRWEGGGEEEEGRRRRGEQEGGGEGVQFQIMNDYGQIIRFAENKQSYVRVTN